MSSPSRNLVSSGPDKRNDLHKIHCCFLQSSASFFQLSNWDLEFGLRLVNKKLIQKPLRTHPNLSLLTMNRYTRAEKNTDGFGLQAPRGLQN